MRPTLLAAVALAACAHKAPPAPRRSAEGRLVTGTEKYDGWFAEVAAATASARAIDERVSALPGPLKIALELPEDARTDEMKVALAKLEKSAARGGAVAIRVDTSGRVARVELKTEGKVEIGPADQLVLDATVATVRQALAAHDELGALAQSLDALKARGTQLAAEASADFRASRRSADAVTEEIQRGVAAIAETLTRAQALTAQTSALAADLTAPSK